MKVEVIQSECSAYLDSLEPNSIDACVTDPPYELGFMGREWDRSGIAFDPEFWVKVKRVLKPGGHLAAFGGSETYHRIAVGIEDAGFGLRETIDWVYASGFAKSHDVGKAIDSHFDKKDERIPVGYKNNAAKKDGSLIERDSYDGWRDNPSQWQERGRDPYERAPATEEAEKWNGWDTQLKPAKEPIIIARKPLEGTVAENVLKYGTGGINVDDCRIDSKPRTTHKDGNYPNPNTRDSQFFGGLSQGNEVETPDGRWPANLIFDPYMAKRLNDQSGRDLTAGGDVKEKKRPDSNVYGTYEGTKEHESYEDVGGAARYFKQIDYHPVDNVGFFYCPKAKRSERDLGVEKNDHVTVKPIELMSYLVRLLTPEEGEVIDPFGGSGTTAMSAVLEGVSCKLIEMNESYADIAEKRVQYAKDNYQSLREQIYGTPKNNVTDEQTEVNDHNFW